jgi:acetylornithine/N-succinyldiaminopimelate aminotransferase
MLVLDEVQCGFARTGQALSPTSITASSPTSSPRKGIGGGFPMGACLATEKARPGW